MHTFYSRMASADGSNRTLWMSLFPKSPISALRHALPQFLNVSSGVTDTFCVFRMFLCKGPFGTQSIPPTTARTHIIHPNKCCSHVWFGLYISHMWRHWNFNLAVWPQLDNVTGDAGTRHSQLIVAPTTVRERTRMLGEFTMLRRGLLAEQGLVWVSKS